MKPLTKKQQAVLDFLTGFIQVKGYPPTRGEIASHFSFKSNNSAQEYLVLLEEKGWISVVSGVSRGIRVVPNSITKDAQ